MKARSKKFLIVCGKVFMLVCLAAFALLCVFYYATPKDKAQAIQANAEEAVASVTDWSKYPTVNLLTLKDGQYMVVGVMMTVSAGTVTFSGKAIGSGGRTIWLSDGFVLPAGNYFISCTPVFSSDLFIGYISDKKTLSPLGSTAAGKFTLKETTEVGFGFNILSIGAEYSGSYNIMLNAGEVAYPYAPSFGSIYNQGYEGGHEAGKQEGYEEGYKDASDTLNLGVLYGTTVSGTFFYENNRTLTLSNGKPDFSYNSLNFNSIWGNYYNYNGDSDYIVERADITLNFKKSFQYSAFPLYFSGDSDVMGAVFIGMDNKRYDADIEKWADTSIGGEYALIKIRVDYPQGLEIKALTIGFGRAGDTLYNANVFANSGGFLNGYNNGYNEGLSNGKTEGHLEGRNEGYNKGYNEGYIKGKSDGFAQEPISKSIRGFVFSLFDAPVSSFLSAFNLSYDGFDLGALVAFIFTGIVVIAVVRLLT